MFITEQDYDHLFRQLCKLKTEAPCHNGICVGYQQCEYGCYGGECAIDVVRTEAEFKYNESVLQEVSYDRNQI